MTVSTRKFENTGKCSNIKNVAPDPGSRIRVKIRGCAQGPDFSLYAAAPDRMPQT